MQIALCDDETTNYETVRELIRQYKQIHSDRTLSLSSFASGKELINHVDEHGCFDLYILDCIMPEMNGIELVKRLFRTHETGVVIICDYIYSVAKKAGRVNETGGDQIRTKSCQIRNDDHNKK